MHVAIRYKRGAADCIYHYFNLYIVQPGYESKDFKENAHCMVSGKLSVDTADSQAA